MKKNLIALLVLMTTNAVAQEIEAVDSIDLETGIIYPANGSGVAAADTICVDSIANPPIPQIPLDECDSLMVSSPVHRYGVVWKNGMCGIYDISKGENVTRIEYKKLWFSFRKEMEGEYYSYFGWDEEETKGIIGVAEANNQFMAISMPKKDERKEIEK
ncbi:hypothetical protein [Prevotella sp. P4-119]|uniref:hypothetical protein n=1 Tax=Prevotella sp. P4-119 TaxID=2024218 RepID=UPI0013032115|nr:hypothetical protein [Prevotella sp. P4-119]